MCGDNTVCVEVKRRSIYLCVNYTVLVCDGVKKSIFVVSIFGSVIRG